MTSVEIRNAIEDLIHLVEHGSGNSSLHALELALDRLALARHFIAPVFEEDTPDAPRREYSEIREQAARHFPQLGFYNVALDIDSKIAETDLAVGDAMDDLTDIALELYDILWYWDNATEGHAQWELELKYPDWGAHLRRLQRYIHAIKHDF